MSRRPTLVRIRRLAACALGVTALTVAAHASDCTQTSVKLTPISDLGGGLYLDQYSGGLYPEGSNALPAAHAAAGFTRAMNVQPRTVDGTPNSGGRYVLLSIGMSNTTQEFSRFVQIANADPQVNHTRLRIIDGAAGGQSAATWDAPTDPNYDRVRDQVLVPQGLSEAQVQAAWLKVANPGPTAWLPAANADAVVLESQMGNILRTMKARYPNLLLVFISSRIYAGYASSALNPEPFAYESGFAVKWVIEAQIDQANGGGVDPIAGDLNFSAAGPAAWIAWGPYLWADGLTPRNDGLIWQCADLQEDGTHPSTSGRDKVAGMLLQHFIDSPQSRPWFRAPQNPDVDGSGQIDVADLLAVITTWGACAASPMLCPTDIAPRGGDARVDISDLLMVINNWNAASGG